MKIIRKTYLGKKKTCDVVGSGTGNFILYNGVITHNSALGYNLYAACIPFDTKIRLANNEVEQIGNLINQEKLEILGFKDGEFIKTVSDGIKFQGIKEVEEITLEDGTIIKATSDHKFLTYYLKRGNKVKDKRDDSLLIFEYKRLDEITNEEIITSKDLVKCDQCGRYFTQITQSHLDRYHDGKGEIKVSDLIRLRIANKAKLRKYNKGYKRKPEVGLKISESLTGRKFSEKHKVNLSNSWTNTRKIEQGNRYRTRPIRNKMNKNEFKIFMSNRMSGSNNPMYGKPPSHGKRVKYKDILFRSSWEVTVAKFLDDNEILWEYEPETFYVSQDLSYTPDFYLQEYGIYLEVKGYFRNEKSLEKFNLFAINNRIMLIKKKEMKDLSSILRFINENSTQEKTG